jgi:hypothetical protein
MEWTEGQLGSVDIPGVASIWNAFEARTLGRGFERRREKFSFGREYQSCRAGFVEVAAVAGKQADPGRMTGARIFFTSSKDLLNDYPRIRIAVVCPRDNGMKMMNLRKKVLLGVNKVKGG